MKTLEVRCCCQPEKLLGYVDVPDHMAQKGKTLVATIRESSHEFAVGADDRLPAVRVRQAVFPIELYESGRGAGWMSWRLAVKAEGYEAVQLETLLMPWNFRPTRAGAVVGT